MRVSRWVISFMMQPRTRSSKSFTSQVRLLLPNRSVVADPPSKQWPLRCNGEKEDKGGKDGKGNPKKKTDGKINIGDVWFDLVSKTPDGRELCYAFKHQAWMSSEGLSAVHASQGLPGQSSGIPTRGARWVLTSARDREFNS